MNNRPDPLDHTDRATLAVLAREYLLCGHLIDRAGMAYLIGPHQLEGMRDVAIDEWMGASPVYTRRMQRLLGFEGDTVATIFKGMQFDIGAPHEFLDFRYTVHDDHHGEFRLDHCGALADVEPMGDDFVVAMCHDIEDPTFDATAMATNSRAQVRPIHRPPRTPADRHPHCAWTVTIDDDTEPLVEPEITTRMAATVAATLPLPTIDSGDGSHNRGMTHYGGEFVDRIELERFSAEALRAIIAEVWLQQHLLSMSFMAAVEHRWGRAEAVRVGTHQLVGIAGLTASRLANAIGTEGRDPLDRLAAVLELHPLGRPHAYAGITVECRDGELIVSLEPGRVDDELLLTWTAIARNDDRVMASIATCVEPLAACRRLERHVGDDTPTWSITLGDQPLAEPEEVTVVRISTGAAWAFETPVTLTQR